MEERDQFREAPVCCIPFLDCHGRVLRRLAVEAIGDLLNSPGITCKRAINELFSDPAQRFFAAGVGFVQFQAQSVGELLLSSSPARIARLAFDKRHLAVKPIYLVSL